MSRASRCALSLLLLAGVGNAAGDDAPSPTPAPAAMVRNEGELRPGGNEWMHARRDRTASRPNVGAMDAPARDRWDKLARVVLLRDYNTRIVLLGTTLLGLSAGMVGAFLLLRKRSLLGDVVGHATLPGVGIAFLAVHLFGGQHGRSLPVLLTGAAIAGATGMLLTVAIRRWTRIKEDAALAIVLSVLFGFGVVLLSVIQRVADGGQAGLQQFIYGQAASLRAADVQIIAGGAALVSLISLLLLKELSLLCFDERYAKTQGWPVLGLDVLLMGLVVAVTVVGLQSVGLLLVVALLIIPAAAARFWTDQLGRMVWISATLGALAAMLGVLISSLAPRLPTGALIVLVGSAFFVISLLFGIRRGLVPRAIGHQRLRRRVGRLDLLRMLFELIEPRLQAADDLEAMTEQPVTFDELLATRSWTARRLRRLLRSAVGEGLVRSDSAGAYRLTRAGAIASRRVARNHRLWELYLIHYADIAPSHVDRDADMIEHVVEPAMWEELNRLLASDSPQLTMPASPHDLSRSP